MNVGAREKCGDFREDIFEECPSGFFAGAVEFGGNRVAGRNFEFLVEATEVWVGNECRECVSRKFDLGNDGDVSRRGVGNDFLDVLLGVEAAVAVFSLTSEAANLGESGVFLNFDTPACVIDEVPVQCIHLVHGHHIEIAQHIFLGEKITGHVEHHTTPREGRVILDSNGGDTPLGV